MRGLVLVRGRSSGSRVLGVSKPCNDRSTRVESFLFDTWDGGRLADDLSMIVSQRSFLRRSGGFIGLPSHVDFSDFEVGVWQAQHGAR